MKIRKRLKLKGVRIVEKRKRGEWGLSNGGVLDSVYQTISTEEGGKEFSIWDLSKKEKKEYWRLVRESENRLPGEGLFLLPGIKAEAFYARKAVEREAISPPDKEQKIREKIYPYFLQKEAELFVSLGETKRKVKKFRKGVTFPHKSEERVVRWKGWIVLVEGRFYPKKKTLVFKNRRMGGDGSGKHFMVTNELYEWKDIPENYNPPEWEIKKGWKDEKNI